MKFKQHFARLKKSPDIHPPTPEMKWSEHGDLVCVLFLFLNNQQGCTPAWHGKTLMVLHFLLAAGFINFNSKIWQRLTTNPIQQ